MIEPKEAEAPRPERGDVFYRARDSRFQRIETPADAARRKPEPTRVAVMIVHGMGQQVPFETLESLTERLTRMNTGAPAVEPPKLTNATFGDLRLQRAEVDLRSGERQLDAHLYEAYWAPTTEGEVFFSDALRFCARGTWNALWHLPDPFYRWMFGRAVGFHPRGGPFLILAGVTVAILEIALISLLVLALALARVLKVSWPATDTLQSMNVEIAIHVSLLAAGFAAIWVALRTARRRESGFLRSATSLLALILSAAAVLASVAILPALALAHWKSFQPDGLVHLLSWLANGWPAVGVWSAVVVCSLVARYFVVQYVGDVVAYVSPQSLDRFSDLRTEIKTSVGKVASAILGAETPAGEFEYERVAFVGHSLGSLIAYDALNKLILDEEAGVTSVRSDERVRLLLTFGSPMDKTAVLFGLNGKDTGVLREQLAARVQPLIDDYRHRQLSWVNVFANLDLFSGALDFYDDPGNAAYAHHRVINVRDEQATVPIAAHEQYWDTAKVWRILHRELFDPGTTSAGP